MLAAVPGHSQSKQLMKVASRRRRKRRKKMRRCACLLIHAACCVYFHSPPVFVLLFSQHALQVHSNQPRARVCVYSAPPTAARQLRPPPSVCAATATTEATPISRTSPAPVSWSRISSISRRAFAGFLLSPPPPLGCSSPLSANNP